MEQKYANRTMELINQKLIIHDTQFTKDAFWRVARGIKEKIYFLFDRSYVREIKEVPDVHVTQIIEDGEYDEEVWYIDENGDKVEYDEDEFVEFVEIYDEQGYETHLRENTNEAIRNFNLDSNHIDGCTRHCYEIVYPAFNQHGDPFAAFPHENYCQTCADYYKYISIRVIDVLDKIGEEENRRRANEYSQEKIEGRREQEERRRIEQDIERMPRRRVVNRDRTIQDDDYYW